MFFSRKCRHQCIPQSRKVGWKCTKGAKGEKENQLEASGKDYYITIILSKAAIIVIYNFILLMIYNPKKGLTWILARDILTGDNANENYCTMQCEMRDECEYTTSLNIW